MLSRQILGRRGVSLVELMVAVSILTVGIMGFISSFRYITRALHVSRGRTLASNLAQEKIENMKNVSYHKLRLSTVTISNANFSPALVYDANNNAPENISIGGMQFIRATHVAFAQVADNDISTITFNYPDPGLKRLRVFVMWYDAGSWRYMSLDNLYENPDIDPLNTTIYGDVDDSGGGDVAGAIVQVLENPDWSDQADSDGEYSFQVHAGTYTVKASSAGFYSHTFQNVGASTGAATQVDFTLTRIGSGTISGVIWHNPTLLISQVVAASNTYRGGADALVDVEYIELFNPTTAQINLTDAAKTTQYVHFFYDRENGLGADVNNAGFNLTFVSTYVGSGMYFLVASTGSFMINGQWRFADAVYGTPNADIIRINDAGCLRLHDPADATNIDVIGWADDTGSAPYWNAPCYETLPTQDDGSSANPDGLSAGDQLVRLSSPLLTSDIYGRAYDSGNNAVDWIYPYGSALGGFDGAIIHEPFSLADGIFPVVSGVPMTGAFVSADDLLGPTTQSFYVYFASGTGTLVPSAHYDLQGVATGTWNVVIASGSFYQYYSTAIVTSGGMTHIPNSVTDPIWPIVGTPHAWFENTGTYGYISGQITDIVGNPLKDIIVNAAGQLKTTSGNGRYFAQVSTGVVTVVANPGNAHSSFVERVAQPTVIEGLVTIQNFTLTQGGVLTGFVTTDGSSILPNVEVKATISGLEYGAGTSDSSGNFYIRNLDTGTYTVAPVLDVSESSDPGSLPGAVSSDGTVFVGTFSIAGAMGVLKGTIKDSASNELITSGALIIASTEPISATPPKVVASSSPAQTFLYAASSLADGTYAMEVRGGADTYYVSAYVPDTTGAAVVVTTKTYSGIVVGAGAETTHAIAVP